MDSELLQKIGGQDEADDKPGTNSLLNVDEAAGLIEIPGSDERYALKPLRELYGQGQGVDTVDPQDQRFMPLFLAIEEKIAGYYEQNPALTDGAVELMLDHMAMDPDAAPADALAQKLQFGLRLCLSLNDYSRTEVKAALKKVRKSVDRHTRAAGPRGYLDFIVKFFGPEKWRSR